MITRAIAALIEIMSDETAAPRRRVEAAAGLLGYEAPAEVAAAAKEFLAQTFENAELSVEERLDAIGVMRKAEARKVSTATVPAANAKDDLELSRQLAMAQRRMEFWDKHPGARIPPRLYDDLSDREWVPPPPKRYPAAVEVMGIAETLEYFLKLEEERRGKGKLTLLPKC